MSGSGYLHWSKNDPFEKMVIFPPDPLPGGAAVMGCPGEVADAAPPDCLMPERVRYAQ
jgi:hypothetical protein